MPPRPGGGALGDRGADRGGPRGLEVDHPDHDGAARHRLRVLAEDLGLLVTGSSDYHGTNKTVRLGQETTAAQVCERIEVVATGVPAVTG